MTRFLAWCLAVILLCPTLCLGAEYSVHIPPPDNTSFSDSFSIMNSSGEIVWFCPYEELCKDLAESLNQAHEGLDPTIKGHVTLTNSEWDASHGDSHVCGPDDCGKEPQ